MKHRRRQKKNQKIHPMVVAAVLLIVLLIIVVTVMTFVKSKQFGFAREVPEAEQTIRLKLVSAAEAWAGKNEADGSHKSIIDIYNNHEPLAQNYLVQYDDQWCATFVSAAAIEAGLTEIIPTECGCQRQIGLFQELGTWQEDDGYIPLPGDIIYYSRSNKDIINDCTGWSDHVGIVIGTNGNKIRVIEGNYGDRVGYRTIRTDAMIIRGFATPDYSKLSS